jgi:hypothetical protein
VNANPSGSRTASTGSRGGSQARREFAGFAGPSYGLARAAAQRGKSLGQAGDVIGSRGGTRRAKMVCRGALVTRRAAQGRVGDQETPRHIAYHLVPHRLLLAKASAIADAVRCHFPDRERPGYGNLVAGSKFASRRAVQSANGCSRRLDAGDSELIDTRYDVTSTSGCAESRGKGVLAA